MPGMSGATPPAGAPVTPPASEAGLSTEANPANVGASLPQSVSEEEAARDFGLEKLAREARAATKIKPVRPGRSRRLSEKFYGPTVAVRKASRSRRVTALGTTVINQDERFDTVVTQSGLVSALYVFPGQILAKDQPVMSLFSPERVNVQHMVLADFSKDAGNQLSLEYFSSLSSVESYLEGAKSNLRWWGFSEEQIDHLLETKEIERNYVVISEDEGYIIDTLQLTGDLVVAGERGMQSFVLPGDTILNQADLHSVWGRSFIDTDGYQYFREGQSVDVIVGEGDDQWMVPGTVAYKDEYVSADTRRVYFQIRMENEEYSLRPGTFITVEADVDVTGLWVPETSVLHLAFGTYVIRKEDADFLLQPIVTGVEVDGYLQVTEGLDVNDRIVKSPRSELDPDSHRIWLTDWY